MKKIIKIILFLILTISPTGVLASENNINCNNRFATIINPVRGRNLWLDKSLKPIDQQYKLIRSHNLSATWLLQYDVLSDKELSEFIKGFNSNQEKGMFLEVSQNLADQAKVIYPYNTAWFKPQAVFLSGYSQSERRRLIDAMFNGFKEHFGIYPKSVGAWWIDSYSLNYLKERYNITSAMIVADQTTTDSYGVWGQWWGVPYYPSKANVLVPAKSANDMTNLVILQWAQRDPLLAYGDGPAISNYSLQANDYIRQGKNIEYFKDISSAYLDCSNPVGQITVGLETGIESVGYIKEYANQMDYLQKPPIKTVTMEEFAQNFSGIIPENPKNMELKYKDSIWNLSLNGRENQKLKDKVDYSEVAFKDYFLPDKAEFLDRKLPLKNTSNQNFWFIFLSVLILLGVFSFYRKEMKIYLTSILLSLAAFGLLFKSFFLYGWEIYFGPVVKYLYVVQIFALIVSYFTVWHLFKKMKKNYNHLLYLLPLSYFLDPIMESLRYSQISGMHYFGISLNALNFFGIALSKNKIEFLNKDLPSYQAAALLRLNPERFYDNYILYFLGLPVIHILVSLFMIYILKKLPKKLKSTLIIGFVLLFLMHLLGLLNSDPRMVLPST